MGLRERVSVLECGGTDAGRKPASTTPLSRGAALSQSAACRPACESGIAPRYAVRSGKYYVAIRPRA